MQSKDKRIISTAVISLFIFSAFTSIPTLASPSPYITVDPSIVGPGHIVRVRGYNFNPGKTVNIYLDLFDDYHHLGSAVADFYGYFSFSFKMENNYIGAHTIIAIDPSNICTTDFTLQFTNPLDQRLIDIINNVNLEVEAIEKKLDTGGAFYNFVNEWFTTIQTAISDAQTAIIDTINGMTSKVEDIENKLDTILLDWSGLLTNVGDIENKLDTEVIPEFTDIERITQGGDTMWIMNVPDEEFDLEHTIYTGDDYTNVKITITIFTQGMGSGDNLWLEYHLGGDPGEQWPVMERIASESDIDPPRTFEICFKELFKLKAQTDGSFEVYYNYIIEYEP